MNTKHIKLLIIFILATFIFGCSTFDNLVAKDTVSAKTPLPDFIPIKTVITTGEGIVEGPVGFCNFDREGKNLEIFVRNKGHIYSETWVYVKFLYGNQKTYKSFVGIDKDEFIMITVPRGFMESFPPGDFDFKITADPLKQVLEEDESNNEAFGHCIT